MDNVHITFPNGYTASITQVKRNDRVSTEVACLDCDDNFVTDKVPGFEGHGDVLGHRSANEVLRFLLAVSHMD